MGIFSGRKMNEKQATRQARELKKYYKSQLKALKVAKKAGTLSQLFGGPSAPLKEPIEHIPYVKR